MASKAVLLTTLGLGVVGGTVGAGYFIHQQLSTTEEKEDIRKKLISDGYEILDDSRNEWTEILTNYRETVKVSGNEYLKFDNFEGTAGKEIDLKKKCKVAIDSVSSNDENYKKAKKWCTVPRTLKSLLGKGVRLLDTNTGDDSKDQNHWNTKITEYNQPNKQSKRFTGLPASGTSTVTSDKNGRDAIKAQCKPLETKKHHEKDFEAHLEKANLWCSIKE